MPTPSGRPRFAILDMNGQRVRYGNLENGTVSLNALVPAMYLFQLFDLDGHASGSIRFIKSE